MSNQSIGNRKKFSCHIRPYRPEDESEIEFIEDSSHKFPWGIDRIYQVESRYPNIQLLVAEKHDLILGHCMIRSLPKCVHILTMGVHPDYRRIGVGSQMIRLCRRKMSSTRRRIVIRVHENAFTLMKFLVANEFILDRRIRNADQFGKNRYPDGSDAYQMVAYG